MKELELRRLIRENIEAFFEEEQYSQFKDLSKSGEDIKNNIEKSIDKLQDLLNQRKAEKNAATHPKEKAWIDQQVKDIEGDIKKKKDNLSNIDKMKSDLDDVQKDIEISQSDQESSITKVDSEITGVNLPSQT
jgi:hypothetical protein